MPKLAAGAVVTRKTFTTAFLKPEREFKQACAEDRELHAHYSQAFGFKRFFIHRRSVVHGVEKILLRNNKKQRMLVDARFFTITWATVNFKKEEAVFLFS